MTGDFEKGPHEHHLEKLNFHDYTTSRRDLNDQLEILSLNDTKRMDINRRIGDLDCIHHEHHAQLLESERIDLTGVNNS